MTDDEKFLIVSLDDEKSKSVAEVLGSNTCKKIINYLAEKTEASEKDISEKLGIPLNTTEYNLKKLLSSGFVRKRKNFFWSAKGKKIPMYELSNKSILISHKKSSTKNKIKSITPAVILTAAGTFAIWAYQKISSSIASSSLCSNTTKSLSACTYNSAGNAANTAGVALNAAAPSVSNVAQGVASSTVSQAGLFLSQPTWEWFLLGGLLSIFIFAIVNWRKL